MATIRIFPLLLFALPVFAQSTATSFTAHLDGYQYPGVSTTYQSQIAATPATADFRIFQYSNTAMRFDFTPHMPSDYTLMAVYLGRGQVYSSIYLDRLLYPLGSAPSNIAATLCGDYIVGPYVRSVCSQTGYVNNNGGELVYSDIFPRGKNKDVLTLLDLMRHGVVFIQADFAQNSNPSYTMSIRGQLLP